jgi:hypothetical protein
VISCPFSGLEVDLGKLPIPNWTIPVYSPKSRLLEKRSLVYAPLLAALGAIQGPTQSGGVQVESA